MGAGSEGRAGLRPTNVVRTGPGHRFLPVITGSLGVWANFSPLTMVLLSLRILF